MELLSQYRVTVKSKALKNNAQFLQTSIKRTAGIKQTLEKVLKVSA